jgi:cytochrome P450
MSSTQPDHPEAIDGFNLIDPSGYEDEGHPHSSWAALRQASPVHRCEPEGYQPYWAITRHADICSISKTPNVFLSSPGIVNVQGGRGVDREGELGSMRTIIEMDPPEHRAYRKVSSPWFTPNALSRLDEAVEASARELVDELAGASGEGECDFVNAVAVRHPLRLLSTILGVEREDEPYILRLTNELFGADDPDLQREGEDRDAAMKALGLELFQYFSKIIEDRRANPRDDLASVLANGKVADEPMGALETFGYFLIVMSAGHDTTKNAIAGGMEALVANPSELARVKADQELVNPLFEEIVRWTTPVNYMMRHAAQDCEVGGQAIREGDALALFYASANRDESVFEDPFAFKADRHPNPHLGFGYGEHFCLGANLARRSARALFRELTSRIEFVESTQDPVWIRSSFVVGLKSLPLRYRIGPAD